MDTNKCVRIIDKIGMLNIKPSSNALYRIGVALNVFVNEEEKLQNSQGKK
ncbi:hypothetical protein [Photobacterium sp. GB-1]|nr:hypothetical protein [Photobacterium sp. GB-1]